MTDQDAPSVRPIGEIVEASLVSFVAETPADRLYEAPAFGSMVRAQSSRGEDVVYAVVASAETSSVEPNRRATAFWQDEATLRQSQPQIFELLSTRFTALILAHLHGPSGPDGGDLRFRLPPRPPRVHGFVYECDPAEVCRVTGEMGILRPLLESPSGPGDELVAAVIRSGAAVREDNRSFIVAAGKQLAVLLRDDYPRLQAIIRKFD